MEILDIHTHVLPEIPGTALVSADTNVSKPFGRHFYSAGIHPWYAGDNATQKFDALCTMLSDPSVLAVGECGLDALKGPSMEIQTDVLIRQLELSESLQKPVILHVVRCFDAIISLKKRLKPKQRWLIHGFRGGPQQAGQLLGLGFELSLGLKSDAAVMAVVPSSRLFLETDGKCDIEDVVKLAASARCISACQIRQLAITNASDFLGHACIVH